MPGTCQNNRVRAENRRSRKENKNATAEIIHVAAKLNSTLLSIETRWQERRRRGRKKTVLNERAHSASKSNKARISPCWPCELQIHRSDPELALRETERGRLDLVAKNRSHVRLWFRKRTSLESRQLNPWLRCNVSATAVHRKIPRIITVVRYQLREHWQIYTNNSKDNTEIKQKQ